MKRYIIFIILCFFLTGCKEEAFITVHNKTGGFLNVSIFGNDHTLSPTESKTKSWKLTNTIFEEEDKTINVSGIGLFKFEFSDNYEIRPDDNINIDIEADAGVVIIRNNTSDNYIKKVYLSLSSDDNWGTNYLSENILPGGKWDEKVSEASWDILIIDDQDHGYPFYNKYIEIGEMVTFTLNQSSKKSYDIIPERKINKPEPFNGNNKNDKDIMAVARKINK